MADQMRSQRARLWLSRCIFVAVALMIGAFLFVIYAHIPSIKHVQHGSTSEYRTTAVFQVLLVMPGLVVGALGILFLTHPIRLFRLAAIPLFVLSLFFFVVVVPIPWKQYLIVTPDYFTQRIGFWYSPKDTKVDFDSLLFMVVVESEKQDRRELHFDLECCLKPEGNKIHIPINDFMKKGLPEIFTNAAKHNVPVLDGPDGSLIPPEIGR